MKLLPRSRSTFVASGILALLAVASNAAQADSVWPDETAASVSIGASGDDQAMTQTAAAVSFVDPMAAVDGATAANNQSTPSTLSFVDTNATLDQASPQYDGAIAAGAPSSGAAATLGGLQ